MLKIEQEGISLFTIGIIGAYFAPKYFAGNCSKNQKSQEVRIICRNHLTNRKNKREIKAIRKIVKKLNGLCSALLQRLDLV